MTLIFIQGICGMSYGKMKKGFLSRHLRYSFLGFLISSICEQEVQVMEVALGSVFPILLSSGSISVFVKR